MRLPEQRLSLFEALTGLIFTPGDTTAQLFEERVPPFGVALLFLLVVSIFTPAAAQIIKYGTSVYDSDAVLSLAVLMVFVFLCFILCEALFLQILQVQFSMVRLFAAAAYAVTPLILCVWLIFAFNYWSTGRLSLVTYLISGGSLADDSFLRVFPMVLLICHIYVAVVFGYALRAMGELSGIGAFFLTVLSLAPLYLSILGGLMVSEAIRPGTITIVTELVEAPAALTVFR